MRHALFEDSVPYIILCIILYIFNIAIKKKKLNFYYLVVYWLEKMMLYSNLLKKQK